MKNETRMILPIPTSLIRCAMFVALASLAASTSPAWSQESDNSAEETGLKLPDDLSAPESSTTGREKFVIEERRIGTRLERVTVYRDNGIQEVYENREVDSLLGSEEKELGEVPNMRRWTIGSW